MSCLATLFAASGTGVVDRLQRSCLALAFTAFGVMLPACLWAQPVTRPDVPLAPMAAAEAERFHVLTQELRCVVCQNENLADSTAPLAQDLKREIREQMLAGKSDDDIKAFLVARYGDFVTYRPPVRANTLLLWGGPLVFVVIAGWLWVRNRAVARGSVQPVDKSFGDNA